MSLPSRYWIWLGGVTFSLLGSQMMAFGMTWAAAAWGGAFAGTVLTAVNLPRVALLLFGGALADRVGAWRVMITSDVAMAVAMVVLGVAVLVLGVQPYLLLATALLIGTVDAFSLPSSGSMPRRLVTGEPLARAVSARQAAGQLAAFAGPSAGGLIVATAGPAAAALLNAGTFAVMAAILVGLRPRSAPATTVAAPPAAAAPAPAAATASPVTTATASPATTATASPATTATAPPAAGTPAPPAAGSGLRRSADGLRVAWKDPLLRPALGLIAATAGFLLPVSGLLIPLLATERHWNAGTGGILAGAIALGIVAVAVVITAAGALPRPGLAAVGGLTLAATAVLALSLAHTTAAAIAAAVSVGLGSGLFTTHVGPLVLGGTPSTHLARVQSVLVLAQSLPLLLTNNALGALNDLLTVDAALTACATCLLLAAALGLRSPALRTATLARAQ
ncbi:hypothetical protein Ade02nite_14210 [Paractinoplanes deccanensis]|uniref:MFS transporter n=1 Tax=Paractinoplanes deccanensis TaxID=113561 RepID=A0ABQ3XYQ9_9ACTN|nr:MFS transporter [Actinoplanes deccanensis]GID72780.1 hypothetical protein Ade02nite_14210 [Actinoplanes deccanensis]